MHKAAYEFVQKYAVRRQCSVIEIGSRNINGSVRSLFPNASWTGLDRYPGPSVDIVIDATEYIPSNQVDMVICCEVLEHCEQWKQLIQKSASWIRPGGRLIVTCANTERAEHSGIDGKRLREGEYYKGVDLTPLVAECLASGFEILHAQKSGSDTQLLANIPGKF